MKGKKERAGRSRGEKEHVGPESLHFSMFILATRATERTEDLECFHWCGRGGLSAGDGCGSQARIWCKISHPSPRIGLEKVYLARFPHAGGRKHHT